MPGGNQAAAILAGIPGLQDSARMKVEAGAAFGNAIAHTGVAIGGIFRAAAQKKVEDDYGVVDNAFQAAMASGKPESMTSVLTAIAPTLKTAKGKAYLADKMGKSFGIRSDMLDIETKKMKLEREKKAPVRTGILFKAQKGDENALAEAMALGDEDFQKEVGGALAVSKSGARAASDQQIQEQDRAEKKRVETMGTKAANELAALIAQDPSLKDKPWKMSQMMSESGKYDLAVQKDAMAKLAVFFGLDQKEDAAKVAADKQMRTERFRGLKAQGKVEIEDPETGEKRIIPDVTSERHAENVAAREKKMDELRSWRGEVRARTKDIESAGTRKEQLALLPKTIQALRSAISAINESEDAGTLPEGFDTEKEIGSLNTQIVELANAFPESANEIMGGKAPPAQGGGDWQKDPEALRVRDDPKMTPDQKRSAIEAIKAKYR